MLVVCSLKEEVVHALWPVCCARVRRAALHEGTAKTEPAAAVGAVVTQPGHLQVSRVRLKPSTLFCFTSPNSLASLIGSNITSVAFVSESTNLITVINVIPSLFLICGLPAGYISLSLWFPHKPAVFIAVRLCTHKGSALTQTG